MVRESIKGERFPSHLVKTNLSKGLMSSLKSLLFK